MAKITYAIRYPLIFFINCYRVSLSRLLGERCRFYPSCSLYAQQAIKDFGLLTGSWLIIKRLLRCHPGCEGGHDPLP